MSHLFSLRRVVAPLVLLLVGLTVPGSAVDFAWFPTADSLDWFGIDNPDVGNSGWTLIPGGLTTQSPDDPDDRAFINATAKTTTLSGPVTVGMVQLGFGAINSVLSLQTSTAAVMAVDAFDIGVGGELQFLNGSVTVTGGVLSNNGMIHAVDHISVVNATVTNTGGGVVQADNGASLFFSSPGTMLSNSATLRTIAGGEIEFDNNVSLTMNGGTIDNQGTFTFGNGTIDFLAGTTSGNPLSLMNTVLNLDPTAGAAAFAFRGGILNGDIAAGQIVIQQNNGFPLVVPDSFTNAGELRLEGLNSTFATLDVMGGGVVTNTGTFRAVASSQFGVNRRVNGTIDNQASLILDPSINLIAEGLLNSGTATIGAGAMLTLSDAGANSGTMTFGAGSRLEIGNNGVFTHSAGNTSLAGIWEFNSASTFNHTGGSLTGSGHVVLNNATLNLTPGRGPMTFEFNNGSLIGNIDAGQTVRQLASFGELNTPDSIINAGLLELAGTAIQEIRLNIQGGGQLTNTGTLHVKAGLPNSFSRRIVGSVINQNQFDIDAGVNLTLSGLINSGDVNMGAGATLTISGGVFSQEGGTITNMGITINNSTVNFNDGDVIGAPLLVAGNSSLNFGPNANGTASFFHAGGNISGTIGSNTTVTLQANTIGTRTIVANASLTNKGNLHFDQGPGGAIALQVDGLQLVNEIGGTLSGNGTVALTVPGAEYINRGVHATGNSPGQFDIDGNFKNALTGILEIEIGGTNATDYDVMIVTGTASLAGTLELNVLSGFIPSIGNMFTVLSATGGVTGQFDQVVGLGTIFDIAYNANSVVITATSAPRPGDFDFDGDVDGNDFLVWQRNPSVVNLVDWQNNYGAPPLVATSAPVPEPSTWVLLSLAAVGCKLARCRRIAKGDGDYSL